MSNLTIEKFWEAAERLPRREIEAILITKYVFGTWKMEFMGKTYLLIDSLTWDGLQKSFWATSAPADPDKPLLTTLYGIPVYGDEYYVTRMMEVYLEALRDQGKDDQAGEHNQILPGS